MTTKSSETLSLEIRRVIKAPRDEVYAAWTDPAQLQQWFGPDNVQVRGLVADVRDGGEFRWTVTNSDGENMSVHGRYRELEAGRKIVFTWQWQDDEIWENRDSLVTVELSDVKDGTEVRLTHEQLPTEQSRDNHNKGWTNLLTKLENFCSRTH